MPAPVSPILSASRHLPLDHRLHHAPSSHCQLGGELLGQAREDMSPHCERQDGPDGQICAFGRRVAGRCSIVFFSRNPGLSGQCLQDTSRCGRQFTHAHSGRVGDGVMDGRPRVPHHIFPGPPGSTRPIARRDVRRDGP